MHEGVVEFAQAVHFEIASPQVLQMLLILNGDEEGHEERHDPFERAKGEVQLKQVLILLHEEQLFSHKEQIFP
jgi:hypothetical protein